MAVDCTISGFLARYPHDFARPNRYIVELSMPPGIPDSGGFMNSESSVGALNSLGLVLNSQGAVQIGCHTCTMPARTLMVYQHSQHSAPFSVPYSQQYEPVTFSFYCGAHMKERRFFGAWQTAVVNLNDNSMNFFDEYTQDVKIFQVDRSGNPTYGVTLYAAYPISLGEVQYDYSSNNQVQNMSVSLAFKLWKATHDTTEIVIY